MKPQVIVNSDENHPDSHQLNGLQPNSLALSPGRIVDRPPTSNVIVELALAHLQEGMSLSLESTICLQKSIQ